MWQKEIVWRNNIFRHWFSHLRNFYPTCLVRRSMHTDYSSLRYLMAKKDAKSWLIRWALLLQDFYFLVNDRKVTEIKLSITFPDWRKKLRTSFEISMNHIMFFKMNMYWLLLMILFCGWQFFLTTLRVLLCNHICRLIKGRNLCMMWRNSFWLILTFIVVVLMVLFDVVSPRLWCWVYWRRFINCLLMGIKEIFRLRSKFWTAGITLLPSMKMLTISPSRVIVEKEKGWDFENTRDPYEPNIGDQVNLCVGNLLYWSIC